MHNSLHYQRKQRGSMLLEALIAIVIFSIGILAIVGLQANSIKMSTDAKFRSDASLLANQYISAMWADMATATNAAGSFSGTEFAAYATGGANFNNWYNNTVVPTLPTGASAAVSTTTTLLCGNVVSATCSGSQQNSVTNVTVTISWQLPGGDTHSYSTDTIISAQK